MQEAQPKETMKKEAIEKAELLWSQEGCQIYATSDGEHVVLEWADGAACRLARLIHTTLRRHALGTSYVGPFETCGILARRLTPLPVAVTVHVQPTEVAAEYRDGQGGLLDRDQAEAVPGVGPRKMEVIEDTALHTGRTLRAYLGPAGITDLTLSLGFGLAATGECQMQVINPLRCQFGSNDYTDLCTHLGGNLP